MTVQNNDILKLVVEIVLGDFTITQNVHYFQCSSVTTHLDSVVLGVVEAWVEAAYGELDGDLCDDYAIGSSVMHRLEFNEITDEWEIVAYLGMFVPTFDMSNVNEPLPNQVSAFATFGTQRPQSRGRKFLPPFGEDRQAATILVASSVTAMTAFADAILTPVNLGPPNYLYPGIVRVGVQQFLVFDSATITDILGTQRRRRPGVGI